MTRIYFPDEEEANAADPVLSSIEDPKLGQTLVAHDEGDALRFDIHLQRREPNRLLRALEMSEELFRPIFVPDKFREAVSGRAWLGAMLEAEGALAHAEAQAGLIPPDAAEAIASRCDAGLFDPEELGRRGRAQGNPVPQLVRVLAEAVSEASQDAARDVHKGATSQDIVDTAAMLLARRALDLILVELDEILKACARLAYAHREMVSRWAERSSSRPYRPPSVSRLRVG